ncbi:MAG: AraC family transcriptional regulator [Clostridia bacterium]|nr:AraC family transcriptional regulator [Clostridia bacterium]
MKLSPRLNCFRTAPDQTSAYLSSFRFDVEFFTHWPQQDQKTLRNLVSSRIKLILQTNGHCDFFIRDTRLDLGPGSCVFIPPFTVYSAQTHEQVDSYELFFNVYPITREQEFLHQMQLDRTLLFSDLLTPADFSMLGACYTAMQEKREGAYAQLNAILTLLLVRAIRAQGIADISSDISRREQALIDRLFAYLDQHLREPVRVEHLCEALQVSQSHLYRCSKNVMNCSTNQLITRYKMQHAQTLLRNPDMTVSEVAEAVGYDPYYFSNQFRKSFLVSPSDYRKNLGKA